MPPSRYRTAAQRFVRKHLADLPEDRRAALVDELEALVRDNDKRSYAANAESRRAYMREYMRGVRSNPKE